MADFVFNVAKGRVNELVRRVVANDPTNSALVVVAIATTATDGTLQDLDTLSAILADANTAEVTNTNYARKVLTDSDLSNPTIDDTNDRQEADMADQTWTSVAAGDDWTDLIICYAPAATSGTDADIIPLPQQDFAVTTDGNSIVAQINANGFYRAS